MLGDMCASKMPLLCPNSGTIAPHKPQDLMTIIVGPSHGSLSRCKIGLGQDDMPPPFCISFNCSKIAFCFLSKFAYFRPTANIWSSKIMGSSLASLYTKRLKGVLQLSLQLTFWIVTYTCNSLYIQCNSLQINYNLVKTTHFNYYSTPL